MAETRKTKGGLINVTIKNPITAGLKKLPKQVRDAIAGVVNDTGEILLQRIKDDTPRDRGSAGGASSKWRSKKTGRGTITISNDAPHINVLEFGGYPVVADRKKKAAKKKKAKKKKKKRPRIARAPGAKKRTNERTGPGRRRGGARLGGFPPGPRTQVAPGGSPTMTSNVSRQAATGMVRQNLSRIQDRFVFLLEEAVEQAFSDIAERGT